MGTRATKHSRSGKHPSNDLGKLSRTMCDHCLEKKLDEVVSQDTVLTDRQKMQTVVTGHVQ